MWPPRRRPVSAPRVPRPTAAGARRNPAQIHQIRAGGMLEEPSDTGFSRTPFRLACRTRTVWQCRSVPSLSGLLPPSPATPGSGCPQLLPGCCDIPTAVSFHHRTVKQRLVAHQVPFPMPGTACSSASAGRSEIMTMFEFLPRRSCLVHRWALRRGRPVRSNLWCPLETCTI